jgi:transcriptional regulator
VTETNLTLLKGTVDILILACLGQEPDRHGYAIAEWIEEVTGGTLLLEEGTLYPALHRLQRKGLLESRWGTSENNRRARFYRLTAEGEAQRSEAVEHWDRYARAISSALTPEGAG